jgi:hypothetical protein
MGIVENGARHRDLVSLAFLQHTLCILGSGDEADSAGYDA